MSRVLTALLACALSATLARADLILSDPGTGVTTTFDVTGLTTTPGPANVDGFSVTGNPSVSYGNTSYGLTANGSWNQSYVSTNSSSGSVTIDLGQTYGLVGGFMNYAPSLAYPDPTITALGPALNVLESFDLATTAGASISTPGATNGGAFRGISRALSDIRFLRISGSYILMHTIEVGRPAAVPEPASVALLGLGGVASLGLAARRRVRRRSGD